MSEQIEINNLIRFEYHGVSCMLFSKITNTALKELQIPKNAALRLQKWKQSGVAAR